VKVIVENVPPELIQYPQWVCWDYRMRHGKLTKIPLQPNGKPASSTDSATWQSFSSCNATAHRFSGIGIVLANGLAGIDLDHHADREGHLSDFAQRLIAQLDTYAEFSPSGTGFHILFRGELPAGGRRNDRVGFEWYDVARYFTVTGRHLSGIPLALAHPDQVLLAIQADVFGTPVRIETYPRLPAVIGDDAELLRRAMSARNGDRFVALWAGDTSAYAGDHSRADLALCRMLVFWTGGDAARVDRLFRQSSLIRGKWNTKHYADGRTYGQATIAKALGR
jgi:putative DNA primase/helicase